MVLGLLLAAAVAQAPATPAAPKKKNKIVLGGSASPEAKTKSDGKTRPDAAKRDPKVTPEAAKPKPEEPPKAATTPTAPPADAPVAAPVKPPRSGKAHATVKLAASQWCHSGVDAVYVETIETRFYDLISKHDISVITPKDVTAVLGIERQKQMLGCTADSSCLAEIGGALGVEALLSGCVVKAGSGFTATLRAVSTADAKPISSFSERVATEDALQDWFDGKARIMALELRKAVNGEDVSAELTQALASAGSAGPPHGLRGRAWIPLVVGAVGGAACAFGFLSANSIHTQFTNELTTQKAVTETAQSLAAQGQKAQLIGVVGAGVAAAGVVTAVVFYVLPTAPPAATPVVAFGPSGATFGVGGEF